MSAGHDLVDAAAGTVDRRVFWDSDVYELEQERIFARCWLFLAHESQIPEAGDYVTTFMGEDEVLVVRQRDGSIAGLLNTCPHRGNRVCHADAGHARGFVCNYHGWAFGLDGELKGMHESVAYEREPGFRLDDHGLARVAQVDTHKGLIFGTLDAHAPSLLDYLGEFAWYLDVLLDNDEGGTELLDGSIRSVLQCNWKLAAENFAGDALHAGWTHDSGAKAMLDGPVAALAEAESYHVNVNGHCWEFNLDGIGNAATLGSPEILAYLRSREPVVRERLGDLRSKMVGSISSVTVFPNLSFLPGQQTFRTWQPRGPHRTELHTWVIVNRSMPEELKDEYRRGAMLTFSPTGVFEIDDGENWEHATLANRGWFTRRQPLHYGLGMETAIDHPELPGNVFRGQVNDANQRAFYERWARLMDADTWTAVDAGSER